MCSRQLASLIPHPLIPPAGTVSSTSAPHCVHTVLLPHSSFTLCHSLPFLFSLFVGQIFVVPQLVCFSHLIGNAADSRNAPSDSPRFFKGLLKFSIRKSNDICDISLLKKLIYTLYNKKQLHRTDLPRFIRGYDLNWWAMGEITYRVPQLPHGRVRARARQADDWLIKDIPVEKWN